mmetsp:Transcript_34460/g.61949  ORF Transcript_34460/g.61949 Transcript_34460/m.61949 type:complete len:152 (+) Transcript_34460:456-911(+)
MVEAAYGPSVNPDEKAHFFCPYADAVDNNLAMITAASVFYWKGQFEGHDFSGGNNLAHCGFDILLASYLEGALAPGSDSNTFKAISISQSVASKIFPERTGTDDGRLEDIQGDIVEDDRRNQTCTIGDTITIHELLLNLTSDEWPILHGAV